MQIISNTNNIDAGSAASDRSFADGPMGSLYSLVNGHELIYWTTTRRVGRYFALGNTCPVAFSSLTLKQHRFCHTFSQCAIGRFRWISWIDRWHTDSQQCSEPRPQTAPAKATGGRQDYHDFEAPLLTMLLVLASQALTDWTSRFDPFLYRIDLHLGPVRCFVTPFC